LKSQASAPVTEPLTPVVAPAADAGVSNADAIAELDSALDGLGIDCSGGSGQAAQPPAQPGPPADPDTILRNAAAKGPASPLPFKAELEAAYGVSLAGLSAYLSQQEALAKISARAAYADRRVFFADRAPAKELVTEEVGHYIQEEGAGVGSPGTSRTSDPAETQARAAAAGLAGGDSTAAKALASQPVAPSKSVQLRHISAAPTTATKPKAVFPKGFDPEKEAEKLYKAMKGWGTHKRIIFDVLHTGRKDMNQAIADAFKRKYGQSLLEWLKGDLSGADLVKATTLLNKGELGIKDKLKEATKGWGTNEVAMFNALERATKQEMAQLRADKTLLYNLRNELSGADLALLDAYIAGTGVLAAKLYRSVKGLGTDEKAIWRALSKATPAEKAAVLKAKDKSLIAWLRSDLNASDFERCLRLLKGKLTNVDWLHIAMAGWGTDEARLIAALSALTPKEYAKLPKDVDDKLTSELSGADLAKAKEILHQKRLKFDPGYKKKDDAKLTQAHGADALKDPGASVLTAAKGKVMSALGELKVAIAGWSNDESKLWTVLATLSAAERKYVVEKNPDGILDKLRVALTSADYHKATTLLQGGAKANKQAVRLAVLGAGTDLTLLYKLLDRVKGTAEAATLLADKEVSSSVQGDVSAGQFEVWNTVLKKGKFTNELRLQWATDRAGTDEALVFEVCKKAGRAWWEGDKVKAAVDKVLKSELSTSDYWKAKDLIRGEPKSEADKLKRAKEMLERQRTGSWTAGLQDQLSYSGVNADDAWRQYKGTYNKAMGDGKLDKKDKDQLAKDRKNSQQMTTDHQAAMKTVSQWASTVAVALAGIVAAIVTGGTAGGLVAALMGNIWTVAGCMVTAAVAKVGLQRALVGEGYDLTSTQAFVDAISAIVEVGLAAVGGHLANKMAEGLSKKAIIQTLAGKMGDGMGGSAGKFIARAGMEGMIDGTMGGVGEGLVQGLGSDKTWAGGLGAAMSNVGKKALVYGGLSGAAGFLASPGLLSVAKGVGKTYQGLKGLVKGADDATTGLTPAVTSAGTPSTTAGGAPTPQQTAAHAAVGSPTPTAASAGTSAGTKASGHAAFRPNQPAPSGFQKGMDVQLNGQGGYRVADVVGDQVRLVKVADGTSVSAKTADIARSPSGPLVPKVGSGAAGAPGVKLEPGATVSWKGADGYTVKGVEGDQVLIVNPSGDGMRLVPRADVIPTKAPASGVSAPRTSAATTPSAPAAGPRNPAAALDGSNAQQIRSGYVNGNRSQMLSVGDTPSLRSATDAANRRINTGDTLDQKIANLTDHTHRSIKYDANAQPKQYAPHKPSMSLKSAALGDAVSNNATVCREKAVFAHKLFADMGIETRVMSGTVTIDGRTGRHAWLQTADGTIIDPTNGKIFPGGRGYFPVSGKVKSQQMFKPKTQLDPAKAQAALAKASQTMNDPKAVQALRDQAAAKGVQVPIHQPNTGNAVGVANDVPAHIASAPTQPVPAVGTKKPTKAMSARGGAAKTPDAPNAPGRSVEPSAKTHDVPATSSTRVAGQQTAMHAAYSPKVITPDPTYLPPGLSPDMTRTLANRIRAEGDAVGADAHRAYFRIKDGNIEVSKTPTAVADGDPAWILGQVKVAKNGDLKLRAGKPLTPGEVGHIGRGDSGGRVDYPDRVDGAKYPDGRAAKGGHSANNADDLPGFDRQVHRGTPADMDATQRQVKGYRDGVRGGDTWHDPHLANFDQLPDAMKRHLLNAGMDRGALEVAEAQWRQALSTWRALPKKVRKRTPKPELSQFVHDQKYKAILMMQRPDGSFVGGVYPAASAPHVDGKSWFPEGMGDAQFKEMADWAMLNGVSCGTSGNPKHTGWYQWHEGRLRLSSSPRMPAAGEPHWGKFELTGRDGSRTLYPSGEYWGSKADAVRAGQPASGSGSSGS